MFVMFSILMIVRITTTNALTFDVFIDYFGNCSSPCSGKETQPYNRLSVAMNSLFSELQTNNLSNSTTLNIHFLNTIYLSTKSENSSLFSNWESQLKTNFTINMMPEACFLAHDCMNTSLIFMLKSQNISFATTSVFLMRNIIFDARDSNLNSSSTLLNDVCYNSSTGCCSDSQFMNSSSDCYFTNYTLTRTQNNEIDFFQIVSTASSFVLLNCNFKYFLSQKATGFYSDILSFQQPFSFRTQPPPRILYLYNLTVNISNVSFYKCYFPNGLMTISRGNSTLYFDHFNIMNYNPYFFNETNNNLNNLMSFQGSFFNFTLVSSRFYLVPNLISSQTTMVIIDCDFVMKKQNITTVNGDANGFIQLNNQITVTLLIFRCNFTFLNFPLRGNTILMTKYSIISIYSQSSVNIMECNFNDMWIFEAQLIVATSNNNITINGINFNNVYHSCSDIPTSCNFPLFYFSTYNNVSFHSTDFLDFYWTTDQSFIKLDSFNSISMINCNFTNITSSGNAVSMIMSNNNNCFSLIYCILVDLYIDFGFYLIELNLYDTLKITTCLFMSELFEEYGSLALLYTSVIVSITNSSFLNMSFDSYAFGLNHNVSFSILNCTCENLFFYANGFIYLMETNNSVRITMTNFTSVSSSSQGGILYLSNYNNASIFSSNFINIWCGNQNGGVFYLNNFNTFTVMNSVFIGCSGYNGGILYAYIGNSLHFFNSTFNSITAGNNGGSFDLVNSNSLILDLGYIIGGGAQGKAGFIIMTVDNKFNMTDFYVTDVFADDEGGFLYSDMANSIYLGRINMKNVTSYDDGGCLSIDQFNNITINQSYFESVVSFLSGGFINVINSNRIILILSDFFNVSCNKTGGFAYLENYNTFSINFANFQQVSAYIGGFFSGSNQNSIRIMNSNLMNIQSSSDGGAFWLFAENLIIVSFSSIINVLCNSSDGGGAYLSENNSLIIHSSYLSYIESDGSGGLVSMENDNNVLIENCEMWNLTTMMNGVLAVGKVNNYLNFTNNTIRLFYYLGLFYFNIQNTIFFNQNILEINYGIYNPLIFYSNSTNNITLINNAIMVRNSVNPIKYYFFQLLSQNSLTLINNDFEVDQCYTFVEAYDQSQIIVNQTVFKQILTVDLKLIYVENSNLSCFMVNFKENPLSIIIEAVNSFITMTNFNYFPFLNDATFFQGSNSSMFLKHGYFYNKNNSLTSQIIYGQYLQLIFNDVSFILIIANSLSSCMEIYDSSLSIKKCFFAFNKANENGGVLNIQNSTVNLVKYQLSMNSSKSIWLKNEAKNMGGCIYLDTLFGQNSTSESHILFGRNILIMNKAFRGGVVAGQNLGALKFIGNKFLKNEAISRNSFNKSKGGIVFIDNSESSNVLLYFNASENNATQNMAEIGGGFYFEGCSFSDFTIHKSRFINNVAIFYGNDLASDSVTIRFYSLQKYLDNRPNLNLDTFKKAKINSIKSGQSYPECLLMINGYDRFGSITYNTDENFLDNLKITSAKTDSIYSNTFATSYYNGFLCFNGTFQRNQMPIPITYEYHFISSFPNSFINAREKIFSLTLEFSQCDLGERMSENFQCIPCSKDTFSFQFNFDSFSDICQSCETQNFYCFGGGNYTVKPGHWRISDTSIIIYKCPNEQACIGDPRNFSDPLTEYNEIYAAGFCETGYTGILCAECDSNYGFLDGYLCSACDNSSYYLKVFSNLLLRIVFTLYLINISMNMCLSLSTEKPKISRIIGTNMLKIFTNHLQVLGILLNFPISYPPLITETSGYLLSVSPNISEAFSIDCLLKKIPLNISLQYFKLIVAVIYPSVLVLLYLFFVSSMKNCKYCLGKAKSKKKNNQNNSLINKVILGISFSILLHLYSIFLKLVKKFRNCFWKSSSDQNSHQNISSISSLFRHGITYKDLILTTFALVTLNCYVDISSMTLAMFGCVKIGDGQTSSEVLFTDFRIDCNSDYHKMWIIKLASPILIFFLFCYPIYIIFSIMWGLKNEEKPLFRFKFGYFFYAYQRKYFFWDFIILLRKLLLILINSVFFSRITETIPNYPIVLVLFIMILAFVLQVKLHPWQVADFNMINKMEELSLIVSNLSIFISLFFLSYPDLDDMIAMFLLIFGFILNSSFFIIWFKNYYSYYLKSRLKKINFWPLKNKKLKVKRPQRVHHLADDDLHKSPLNFNIKKKNIF